MMDPITATLAVAQLINQGLTVFQAARGKAANQDLTTAIDAGLQIFTQAQQVAGLIVKAHAEGRDITEGELNAVVAGDDAARKVLVDAIARAEASAKPDAPGT